ncbi:MAG: MarR family winged helix-turn-helix transcriptional regulator [Archangium sp.]
MSRSDVRAIQRAFPQIHAACHAHHGHALQHGDEDILSHLDLVLGARTSELAKHLSMEPATLTSALRRLSKAGLVKLSKSSRDRRHTVVKLTEKGEAVGEQEMLDDAHLEEALAQLSAAERRKVVEGLTLLAGACARIDH